MCTPLLLLLKLWNRFSFVFAPSRPTALHVELQSSFIADPSSTQWIVDSGASKHICFDRDFCDWNTVEAFNLAWAKLLQVKTERG